VHATGDGRAAGEAKVDDRIGRQQREARRSKYKSGRWMRWACRQSTHTWTHAHTHAHTYAEAVTDRERKRESAGPSVNHLKASVVCFAMQPCSWGGAMVWSRTPRTGPLGRCGSAKNIGSLGERPIWSRGRSFSVSANGKASHPQRRRPWWIGSQYNARFSVTDKARERPTGACCCFASFDKPSCVDQRIALMHPRPGLSTCHA
jgi:hypothetical protein